MRFLGVSLDGDGFLHCYLHAFMLYSLGYWDVFFLVYVMTGSFGFGFLGYWFLLGRLDGCY